MENPNNRGQILCYNVLHSHQPVNFTGVRLCPALCSCLVCTPDVTGYVSWNGVNGMEDVSIFVSFIPEKIYHVSSQFKTYKRVTMCFFCSKLTLYITSYDPIT
jgi:hypothetical protein